MFSVFAAFVLGNDPTIKLFGLALSTAVLFDAFIVRLIIVPSIMYQFGKVNWWLPGWLEHILPKVAVESEEDIAIAEAEIGVIDDLDDEVVGVK
jgi:RND superfamily putative drug exporter